VHAFPAAECFIDGRPVGMTPVYRQRVPAGVHAVMLKREQPPQFTKIIRITVKPEDEEKLVYKHEKYAYRPLGTETVLFQTQQSAVSLAFTCGF
jgi:hypothetical protein